MSLRARRLLLMVAVAVTAAAAAIPLTAAIRAHPTDGTGRIVLVSGRDDHGLVASRTVSLLARPDGRKTTGETLDGTLAQVVRTDGEWLDLRTVEGKHVTGWVNDFYLRGVVHLVGPAPSCLVTINGHDHPAGEQATVDAVKRDRVLVTTLRERRRHQGWVARAVVHELAPTSADGCPAAPAPVAPDTH